MITRTIELPPIPQTCLRELTALESTSELVHVAIRERVAAVVAPAGGKITKHFFGCCCYFLFAVRILLGGNRNAGQIIKLTMRGAYTIRGEIGEKFGFS